MVLHIALALVLAALLTTSAHAQDTPVVRFTVDRFVVTGENPLSADASAGVLTPFTGEHQGLAGLQSAADALQRAIAAAGHPFRNVVLPPQRLTEGTVTLQVVAVGVGKVSVEGNEYFDEANIRASLPALREGVPPDTRALARSLRLANEHPSKKLTVTFKESESAAEVDARVTVKDRHPLQVFGALSNTGSDETGLWRTSVGLQYANLFDSDHVLTVSYTTSPGHPAAVKQWGAHYLVPIQHWDGAVSLFYTRADVTIPQLPGFAGVFAANGKGEFSGARYVQLLSAGGPWSRKLTFGVDDKLFESQLSALGTPVANSDVRSTPASIQYSALYETPALTADARLEFAHNLGLGSLNTQRAYTASRTGASVDWSVVRAAASMSLPFTAGVLQNWLARVRFDGQLALEPLITGEQFGAGGAASVRGFDEREVSGDSGAGFSFEMYTPELVPGLRFLGFLDTAFVTSKGPDPGPFDREQLASIGVGARWQWRENVSTSLDIANVLNGSPLHRPGTKNLHFSLFMRY